MDWHLYLGLAIGAVVTTIVGSFAKWVFGIFETFVPAVKASAALRELWSHRRFAVFIWDVVWLVYSIRLINHYLHDTIPVTRTTIVSGVLVTLNVLFWSCLLVFHIGYHTGRYRVQKMLADLEGVRERASELRSSLAHRALDQSSDQ